MKTLIIGGARSGKSNFALQRASLNAGSKAYIATARALDDEMRERIAKHKKERSNEWATFEEPLDLAQTLKNIGNRFDAIIIDCLTLWVSNLLLSGRNTGDSIDDFVSCLSECNSSNIYIVSNEVGLGIVPDNVLSRTFRDVSGLLNQKVAYAADEVYLVAAGIPVKIKGQTTSDK